MGQGRKRRGLGGSYFPASYRFTDALHSRFFGYCGLEAVNAGCRRSEFAGRRSRVGLWPCCFFQTVTAPQNPSETLLAASGACAALGNMQETEREAKGEGGNGGSSLIGDRDGARESAHRRPADPRRGAVHFDPDLRWLRHQCGLVGGAVADARL